MASRSCAEEARPDFSFLDDYEEANLSKTAHAHPGAFQRTRGTHA
jgi:hypothetical protein